MKRSDFLLALLGTIASVGSVAAGDCDSLSSGCTSGKCVCRDDRGLLDVIDEVAGRIHTDVRQLSRSMRASRNRLFSEHGCDHGCDVMVVGREMGDSDSSYCPECQGENFGAAGPHYFHHSDSMPGSQASGAGEGRSPAEQVPSHPEYLRSMPQPAPVPDTQVNPFLDEPRTGARPIPGRTIQYQRKSPMRPQYGQRYNQQAQRASTADYWDGSESEDAVRNPQVKTASNNPASLEYDFQFAHRRRVADVAPESQSSPVSQNSEDSDHWSLDESSEFASTAGKHPSSRPAQSQSQQQLRPSPLPRPQSGAESSQSPTLAPPLRSVNYDNPLRP